MLCAGITYAFVVDPALLDQPRYRWPLLAAFVGLMMVPRLAVLLRPRGGLEAGSIQTAEVRQLPLWSLTRFLAGMLGGLSLGAAFLAVPGLPTALGQVKARMLSALFGGSDWVGVIVAILGVVACMFLMRLFVNALKTWLLASRFALGLLAGVLLWVPFSAPLSNVANAIGLSLPGLNELTVGALPDDA